jgi:hypothetical protein
MNSVVLGIIFFIHGLNLGPRRADVVLAASVWTGLLLAGNHGLLNENSPVSIALLVLAVIVYIRGAWIERRK